MKVVTDNAGNASTAKVTADYARLAALDVDVIGSQEVTDRAAIIAHVPGMTGIQKHTQPNSAHVALNIRDGLPYSDVQLKKLNKLTWVGRLVAGARKSGKSKIKYILSALVDGRRVGVTHLVPSWTRKRCILARRLARKQVKGCVEWFNAGGDVLMMDGNGPANHKVFAPLRAVAVPYAKGKSHGIERDIIWVRKGAASHVDVTALTSSSDHPPVVADITWAKQKPSKPASKPTKQYQEQPVNAARIDAVDLSHWQDGNLNFTAASKAGVKAVWHKATEATRYVDPNFARRRREVAAAKIPFGAYHFADPKTSGRMQAAHFLSVAQPKTGDLRPMLDFEDATFGHWSRAKRTAWVKEWVDEVQKVVGEPPVIYTRFDLDEHFDCPLWVARYSNAMSAPNVPTPWKAWSIWQFSNGAFGHPNSVPGLGHCDINTFNSGVTVPMLVLGQKAKPAKKSAPSKPKPAAPVRPKLERDTIAGARTIASRAAKHGNKHRASKWRALVDTMLGRK